MNPKSVTLALARLPNSQGHDLEQGSDISKKSSIMTLNKVSTIVFYVSALQRRRLDCDLSKGCLLFLSTFYYDDKISTYIVGG